MTESDKKQFTASLLNLAQYFDKIIEVPIIELYWKHLSRFDSAAVARAMKELECNNIFFPKVAEFLQILEPKGRDKELAGAAWNQMSRLIASQGVPTASERDNIEIACITHTLRRMGFTWASIGAASQSEMPFIRNKFIEAYKSPETETLLELSGGHSAVPGIEGLVKKLCGGEDQQ